MADLVIVAASVLAGSNATRENGTAGETIIAGQALYKSATTNKYMKADSNSVTAGAKVVHGISLNGGALDQPIVALRSGDITIGATIVGGTAYYLSDTPGGICPVADVGAGEDVCLIGLGKSTTVLTIDIQAPGVTL